MEVCGVWKRNITVDGKQVEQTNEDNIAVYQFLLVTTKYCGILAKRFFEIFVGQFCRAYFFFYVVFCDGN